jgi:hypothetical protein
VLATVKVRPGEAGICGRAGATADLDGVCARRRDVRAGRGEGTEFQCLFVEFGGRLADEDLRRSEWGGVAIY